MIARTVHEILTDDDEGRLCKDIPEEACKHQPRNFSAHILSLSATKTGDGLADAKLVLAWLLGALGAPAYLIGLLVPIREALALLPQLFTSSTIRSMAVRKWAWIAGSFVQGSTVIAMALVALTLNGATAGWVIVVLLAVFALARSVCSVSYKDVLGKTVSKETRGTATGTASSAAAASVFAFGLLVNFDVIPLTVQSIACALFVGGCLWLGAALVFSTVREEAGATEGGADGIVTVIDQFSLLREDPQLVRFIAVRGLLTATALAPPFLLAMVGQSADTSLSTLGPFVIASSLATMLSGYIWGRFADQSSRWVLIVSALTAGLLFAAVGASALLGAQLGQLTWLIAGALFILMISYQGVRLGRSTHLTDMADESQRASYTALSNTAIGVLLLVGGVFGVIADVFGTAVVLCAFSVMCLMAALLSTKLDEVQRA